MRAGTIEGSVYVVNVGELVRPVRTFFKPRVTYGHLPDYAKRVFDYCQNNGLFPRLEYWDTASNPDSHFSFDSANHRVASDAFIYAGWKALKALRRSTPNG